MRPVLRNVLIFGNSGSGKSTLAQKLKATAHLAHLDLDVLAWQPTTPPQRQPLSHSAVKILTFIEQQQEGWVIEGCYTDLLHIAEPYANEVIYLNLPTEQCIQNAKKRPWEPHKYDSKAAQDNNLNMLIDWIRDYDQRDDTFSRAAHEQFYAVFPGKKSQLTHNT